MKVRPVTRAASCDEGADIGVAHVHRGLRRKRAGNRQGECRGEDQFLHWPAIVIVRDRVWLPRSTVTGTLPPLPTEPASCSKSFWPVTARPPDRRYDIAFVQASLTEHGARAKGADDQAADPAAIDARDEADIRAEL